MKTRENKKTWKFPIKMFIVFLVLFCIILGQFAYISLFPNVYGINIQKFATNRNTVKTTLRASRGSIYDSEGNILAINVTSYTVIAYLSSSRKDRVEDIEGTAKALSPILNMTEERITNLLSTKNVYQVELGPGGRGITELTKKSIQDLNLPGIDFVETQKRYYPNGDFASYIIGYAKKNSDEEIVGELGIESKYNDILKGTDGSLTFQRNNYGYKIPDTPEIREEAQNGSNIYLTLDSGVQRFLEDAIKTSNEKYSSDWMLISVMDAKTGKILGSATTPSYNPNILNITNYENPLVTYTFEPGSTMKIYTYMCAIDKGTYKGDDTYLSGSIAIGPNTISDWNRKGWGSITFDLGFEYSSNVAVSTMIKNKIITKDELYNCLTKYGFGSKTGIELSREMTGKIKFNYEVEVATASYGQGITTTPIQHLQALSLIANNGKMIKPYILDKITDGTTGEITYEGKTNISEQLVKEETITKIKDLMYNVINAKNIGTTGRAFRIEGLDVIGKTGTAEVYENGKYGNSKIYSFAGMFPKNDPKVIIYAAVKNPSTGNNAPISTATKNIMQNIAKYYNIKGTTEEKTSTNIYIVESYINKSLESTRELLNSHNINTIVLGNGTKVIDQYPNENDTILETDKIILLTEDKEIKMPDIINWSKKDVQGLLNLLKINYEFDGYGFVTEQSILKNTIITNESNLIIKLKDTYLKESEKEEETTE